MTSKYDFDIRLNELRRVAKNKYLDCIFIHAPHFTIHGSQHSSTMESNLDIFLQVNDMVLTEYEDFILRCAIWLHDIGMIKREIGEDISDVRKYHNKKSQDMIDGDEGRKIFNLNGHESFLIGIISYLHRKSADIRLIEKWVGSECVYKIDYINNENLTEKFNIHCDKLAMLLRLLDACDRSHIRSFDPDALQSANIPEAGKYHWAHHLISSVDLVKNKIIINSMVPPLEGNVSSKEENIITDLIINDMKREIDSLDWVLKKFKLFVLATTLISYF